MNNFVYNKKISFEFDYIKEENGKEYVIIEGSEYEISCFADLYDLLHSKGKMIERHTKLNKILK